MTQRLNPEDLELSDGELLTVLKNHGIDRRALLKVFGVSTGVAALGGTAAGSDHKGQKGNRIDEVYGAPYAADRDTVPSGLVDHEVVLHVHGGDAEHEGFPVGDGPDPDDQDDAPETFFDPVGLHVKPGGVVQFRAHGMGLHTVTSFHPKFDEAPFFTLPKRVPTEYGFSSPPIGAGDSWLYRFTTKGVYDILCLPHVGLGMVMRIVVFDPEEDDINDPTFGEYGPVVFPAANAVLSDPKLDPSNIVDEGEVAWSDLTLP